MKATVSVDDLASTGMSPKEQGPPKVDFARRMFSTLMGFAATLHGQVSSTLATATEKVSGATSQAKSITANAFDNVKVRGIKTVEFVREKCANGKQATWNRVASLKSAATTIFDEVRARASKIGSSVKQRTLGYIPAAVKTNISSCHSYILAKISNAHATSKNLMESARSKMVTNATFAQRKALQLKESCHSKAVKLGSDAKVFVVDHTPTPVKSVATSTYTSVSTKASEVNAAVKDVAADPKARAAAAGAAGGAVALGSTGGAVGMVSGSIVGAAAGIVPAIFTFGLSIPIGAMIGGGAGLCVGTAVGGTTGLVAGGAAGYKKDAIKSGSKKVLSQAGDCAQYAKDTAGASRQLVLKHAQSSATYVRARVGILSGTGGTDALAESD